MNISITRHKKKRKSAKTNGKKSIPTKKQRLRMKVSSMGRVTLQVEEMHPKALEDIETEGDTDERSHRQSKKQKRFVERAKMPSKRRSRNKR